MVQKKRRWWKKGNYFLTRMFNSKCHFQERRILRLFGFTYSAKLQVRLLFWRQNFWHAATTTTTAAAAAGADKREPKQRQHQRPEKERALERAERSALESFKAGWGSSLCIFSQPGNTWWKQATSTSTAGKLMRVLFSTEFQRETKAIDFLTHLIDFFDD